MKKVLLTLVFSVILSTLSFAQTVQKTYYFGTPMVSEMNGYDVLRFADTITTVSLAKLRCHIRLCRCFCRKTLMLRTLQSNIPTLSSSKVSIT